jgi:TonB family protein
MFFPAPLRTRPITGLRSLLRIVTWLLPACAVALFGQVQNGTASQQEAPPQALAETSGLAHDLAAQPMSEELLQHILSGKFFYLRNAYLDNSLSFNVEGKLDGSSPTGSFTLGLIQINKVHLTKKKLELEGIRYGLHFLGALPSEDLSANSDKVRITPKKKVVKISIEREQVVKPKKVKGKKGDDGDKANDQVNSATDQKSSEEAKAAPQGMQIPESKASGDAKTAEQSKQDIQQEASPTQTTALDNADSEEGKTTSQEHADGLLRNALDTIFAPSLDARMMDKIPPFWQAYFHAAAMGKDEVPALPGVLSQLNVDKKAQLSVPIEPESNQYAQDGGVAGMALYHTVVDADGKAGEIAVARPIGFGLDENAVKAIQQATFQPAMKDGKPVPVWVDVVVQFRIYSKRTGVKASPSSEDAQKPVVLPGPYSVPHS